jgi:ZIP family zinc transporter
LHNFSEGLAIGQSAASGQISLAVVLVVGFGLHNATEGFGITAPLAGQAIRPSRRHLAVLGIIGGLPTLVGTLLGSFFVNEVVSVVFLALAAGSILYVIIQLLKVAQKLSSGSTLYVGVLGGLSAGLVTDFIVTAAGV